MSVVRFDPLRDLTAFRDDINRLFVRTFGDGGEARVWSPAVDVFEKDDAVVLKAELPGLTASDVTVEIDDNVLTVSGERTFKDEVEDGRYHRIERSYGKFSRSLTLPQGIDAEAVAARFADGVLEVTVPKAEVPTPRKVAIETAAPTVETGESA